MVDRSTGIGIIPQWLNQPTFRMVIPRGRMYMSNLIATTTTWRYVAYAVKGFKDAKESINKAQNGNDCEYNPSVPFNCVWLMPHLALTWFSLTLNCPILLIKANSKDYKISLCKKYCVRDNFTVQTYIWYIYTYLDRIKYTHVYLLVWFYSLVIL